MQRATRKSRKGFTLIEVLLVAGILAVLAAFAIPQLMGVGLKAKNDLARAAIGRNGPIAKGLDQFEWAMGRLPDTDEGLAALYSFKGAGDDEELWDGPYMQGTIEELMDPWRSPYEYRGPDDAEYNEDKYDLWSRGKNRKDDDGKEGSDDIKNWLEK